MQDAAKLIVKEPLDGYGVAFPDIVLKLDGSLSTITQRGLEGGPNTQYSASAKWDGNVLVVTRTLGAATINQSIALDAGKLTITTRHVLNGELKNANPRPLVYVKR